MATSYDRAARQTTTTASKYERLCELADIQPIDDEIELDTFTDSRAMADMPLDKRLTAGLQVFLDLAARGDRIERIDKTLLDQHIGQLDDLISEQLDEIMHHPDFQEVESAWRSLYFLISRCDPKANVKVEVLDVSKRDLLEDFEDVPDVTQSGLYQHTYVQEYDTPGGEPISTMVSNYEFDASAPDITLLREVSRVAAAAHCPFLGSVGAQFFGKQHIDELTRIDDLGTYLDRAEYIRWRGFRDTEDARYVGLTLPRFMLRIPYGEDNPVRSFSYRENVTGEDHEKYLWGNSSFAFAANIARSFKHHGWAVNIRGPESGGKLEHLPMHYYDMGRGRDAKIPTEMIISETKEYEYAEQGFIPLSYYKNSDYACFFSANSVQRPQLYSTNEATANARINSRLPYIFLVSRLAHYLKVLQRENIGSNRPRKELERELNDWLQGLVTKMKNPDPELIATHPLQDGEVTVEPVPDNPGYYRVGMSVMPHFQVEGVDVSLSLVSQLPSDRGN
jgi:type VI secretion system protein ImpC